MAVINSVPGLTLCVKVDGEPATEYDNPDDEVPGINIDKFDVVVGSDNPQPPHVIKYIEAKPGARYIFHLTREPSFQKRSHHIALALRIDGKPIGVCHIDETWLSPTQYPVHFTIGHVTLADPENGYQRLGFSFAPLEIDGLIKEGIIPRPDAGKEVDNMTEAEVRQRLVELMEQQSQTPNNPRIKREASPMADDEFMARYKTRRLDNGKVEVDLTDD
ncbi:hypothetical protein NEMBOFW57_003685 [Staphylotrichum longicolle]|uniref:DUF7918 domain-containing protein n=1 Tax=Staphylotrichum longicolle TaxID=669026 RepID=A0AAD4F604_9PEZI|nr:hypothetical protein NEMBOFW57_003685 [Staphylotrichum longicolle]